MRHLLLLSFFFLGLQMTLCAQPSHRPTTGHSQRHGHGYLRYGAYTNHNFGWEPVADNIFEANRDAIRRCGYDEERLLQAELFANRHYLSAAQVAELTRLFTYDKSRLKFAKHAFASVCDVHHYPVVFQALVYMDSGKELDAYIRDYRWGADCFLGGPRLGQRPTTYHGHGYLRYSEYTNHNFGWEPVNDATFEAHLKAIRQHSYDEERLKQARTFARGHHLSSAQIAKIVRLFTYEEARLKFAKYAFGSVCDAHRYDVVFKALGYQKSGRELDNYIRDYRW